MADAGSGTLQVLPNLKEETGDLLTPVLVSISELGLRDTIWWCPDFLHRLEEWNSAPHFTRSLRVERLATGAGCSYTTSLLDMMGWPQGGRGQRERRS